MSSKSDDFGLCGYGGSILTKNKYLNKIKKYKIFLNSSNLTLKCSCWWRNSEQNRCMEDK